MYYSSLSILRYNGLDNISSLIRPIAADAIAAEDNNVENVACLLNPHGVLACPYFRKKERIDKYIHNYYCNCRHN